MRKLSIKDLVAFRDKSDKTKKNFVAALKNPKENTKADGGGDYWISCLSALSNSYRENDIQLVSDKISELTEKIGETQYSRTKDMYQRNIDILSKYENFDLRKWRRLKKMNFIKQHKEDFVLNIKGLEIGVAPHRVFSFQNKNTEEIGAIWFLAKLDGFRKEELGMFADIQYRYLKVHFEKKHSVNNRYCIAVDVANNTNVNYEQLVNGTVQQILNPTIDELKKMM